MYFASFPKIYYDSKGQGNPKVVTNLLRRVAIRTKVKSNAMLYDTYDVKNGDTPESIADKLYGDSNLHWVILMVNNITDRFHQWPLMEQQFNTFVNEKYSNPDGIHHYEITQSSGKQTGDGPDDYTHKIEVNSDTAGAQSVSNIEYEQRLQDKKRQINLLLPAYLGAFEDEFTKLIRR